MTTRTHAASTPLQAASRFYLAHELIQSLGPSKVARGIWHKEAWQGKKKTEKGKRNEGFGTKKPGRNSQKIQCPSTFALQSH
jgi:hypothetical protein